MDTLSDSQEHILLKLKQRGPQTVRVIADALDMTKMGARQHLNQLSELGLVSEAEPEKQARGRPVRPWRLTYKAQARFPDTHSQFSVELIASVRDTFGEDGLNKLIQNRSDSSLKLYSQQLNKLELAKRIKKLAQIRSEEGYMAEVEKLDATNWLLIENHCPICAAATSCQGFCQSELEIFQSLFDGLAKVQRDEHILQGARRCCYRIEAI